MGDKSDVAENDSVTIFGNTENDGLVTANRIVVDNQG
jgi:hypothetical protein